MNIKVALELLNKSVNKSSYENLLKKYSMEFPTKDALDTYLEQHPKANPKNHKVKEQKKHNKPKENKSKNKTRYFVFKGFPCIIEYDKEPRKIVDGRYQVIKDTEKFFQEATEIDKKEFDALKSK
jgi:hypothetical protein